MKTLLMLTEEKKETILEKSSVMPLVSSKATLEFSDNMLLIDSKTLKNQIENKRSETYIILITLSK